VRLNRHIARHDEVSCVRMVARMPRDETGTGNDVVIHEQHHLTPAPIHPERERRHLPALLGQDRTQVGKLVAEHLEEHARTVHVAVEHDHDLCRRRVTCDGLDEGAEQVTPVPRGDDHRNARKRARPAVAFVAWGAVSGRSREIAAALGGEAHCLFPPESSWRPHAAIRYLLCTVDTVAYLARRRPRSLVVTNPPLVAGFVVLACGRLLGCPVVLDSHPGGFGAQGDSFSARLQAVHRWLARHVDGCAVASQPWVDVVTSWGGRAIQLHEAPGELEQPVDSRPRSAALRVLCVGRLAPDEPSEAVIRAAALVPGCEFFVTGDVSRAPELRDVAPPNVTFTGFLDPGAYGEALRAADVVMTLTTEPSSVMRAAYEAVYARKPVIVTDWPVGRELFPYAVHVGNDAESIAEGVRHADEGFAPLLRTTDEARDLQLERWEAQLHQLRLMLGLPPHEEDGSSTTGFATPSPPPRNKRDGVLARIRTSLQKVQVST